METIYLDDFLTDGLIKETEFRDERPAKNQCFIG